ncbi:MAG: hypothetical protein ACKO0W_06210 [Planctomycetota bacterium]
MKLRSLLAPVLAAALAATAFGQASLDKSIIAAAAPLTDAQKAAVGGFIDSPAEAIRSADRPGDVEAARQALITPARDPSATTSFRRGYSAAVVAELAPVAKGRDLRRAIVAMQVLRFLRTQEAVDVLIERTSPTAEPDAGKRIAAASLVADGCEDLDVANSAFDSIARRLRDNAAAETDWIALQQKLSAIAAPAKRRDFPADNARNVRRAQAEAIASVAKAMRAGTAADARMQALQRALIAVRNDLLTLGQAERSAVAKTLAPALSDLLAAGLAHWDSAHANPAMNASYEAVANSCEVLLRLLDRGERPQAYSGTTPDGDSRVLGSAWSSKDKSRFEAESKRWAGIVSAAPYK